MIVQNIATTGKTDVLVHARAADLPKAEAALQPDH